jgi:hypothetical protein
MGHNIYFESIINYFTSENSDEPLENYTNRIDLSSDLANAYLQDMSTITSTSCEFIPYENELYMFCNKGDAFSAVFTGNVFGVVGRIRSDGGQLECKIDNIEKVTLDFWDHYALKYNRTNYFLSLENLENYDHELTCTITDHIISDNFGHSQGHIVEIHYFMINP